MTPYDQRRVTRRVSRRADLPCPPEVTPTQWQRYLNRITVNETTGCWEWVGSRNSAGYPTMHLAGTARGSRGREVLVTRWILAITVRPFKKGELACHGCDNSLCVRPGFDGLLRQQHLEHGDHSYNLREAWHRRRRSRPSTFLEL